MADTLCKHKKKMLTIVKSFKLVQAAGNLPGRTGKSGRKNENPVEDRFIKVIRPKTIYTTVCARQIKLPMMQN